MKIERDTQEKKHITSREKKTETKAGKTRNSVPCLSDAIVYAHAHIAKTKKKTKQKDRIRMQNEQCRNRSKHLANPDKNARKKCKKENNTRSKLKVPEKKKNKAGGYLNKRFMQMMKRMFQAMTGRRGAIGIAFGPAEISRFDMSMSLPSYFWSSFGCLALETRTG